MTHFENWSLAALFAALLLITSALLEGPDDVQAEVDTAAAVADAREQALREHAGRQRCAQLRERGAEHLWDVAGSLDCKNPRHRLVAMGLEP